MSWQGLTGFPAKCHPQMCSYFSNQWLRFVAPSTVLIGFANLPTIGIESYISSQQCYYLYIYNWGVSRLMAISIYHIFMVISSDIQEGFLCVVVHISVMSTNLTVS